MRLMTSNATSFQGKSPLDNDTILRYAPSVFAREAHASRSERYSYVPTVEVLDGLRKEGFQPFFVAQSRSRIEGKAEFTKHLLRLRHESAIDSTEAREVILVNSHDGTSSYNLTAGLIRFVCMNGLIVGDDLESIKVYHKGNIKDDVIEGAYQVVKSFDVVDQKVIDMKETKLLTGQAEAFAEAAIQLRYDENAPVTPSQVLQPRRREDNDSSLWTAFNRTQESLVRGGLNGIAANGRRARTRAITGIGENVKLNRALWTLAERMGQLVKAS